MQVQSTVEYRPVEGFPGYCVGSDGSVWSSWRHGPKRQMGPWRMLKTKTQASGHQVLCLVCDRVVTYQLVHRLILLAFVGPCPPGHQACHDNGIPSDNRLSNLRWDTAKANAADRERHGRTQRGERHARARLTVEKVRAIRIARAGGMRLCEIARQFLVNERTVTDVLSGRTWAHVT